MSIILILPVLVINTLLERRSFTYILIHLGYWAVTLNTMFMVIAQFG